MILIQQNLFEIIICKMLAILFKPQWMNFASGSKSKQ